jgi:hypothetical protein
MIGQVKNCHMPAKSHIFNKNKREDYGRGY